MSIARSITLLAMAATAFTGSALACSDKDWKACKGKPWVTGDTMDTPMAVINGASRSAWRNGR